MHLGGIEHSMIPVGILACLLHSIYKAKGEAFLGHWAEEVWWFGSWYAASWAELLGDDSQDILVRDVLVNHFQWCQAVEQKEYDQMKTKQGMEYMQ